MTGHVTSDHLSLLSSAFAGRYRIERRLGEGGMAVVYPTEDLKHNRMVALKGAPCESRAEPGFAGPSQDSPVRRLRTARHPLPDRREARDHPS